jgi:hypothetical protein
MNRADKGALAAPDHAQSDPAALVSAASLDGQGFPPLRGVKRARSAFGLALSSHSRDEPGKTLRAALTEQ